MKKNMYLSRYLISVFPMLAAIICLSLAPLSSRATTSAAEPCRTITLAYYELGALFYRVSEGVYAGIDKDVVEELERRTHCHFETSIESRVRIWAQLSNNTLDMSVSGISTPEREKFAQFIPYFSTRNYVLMSKDTPSSAQTMEGFLANPTLVVAVVKSFRHGPVYDKWLDKLRAQKRVYETADAETALRLFSINRVHAVLALPTTFQSFLQLNNLAEKTLVKDWAPLDSVVHGLIVSKARVSQAHFDILEKAMRSMRDDGTLENIFRTHIGYGLAKEIRYVERKP